MFFCFFNRLNHSRMAVLSVVLMIFVQNPALFPVLLENYCIVRVKLLDALS
uniref:Uncharacterized protein n=1 Tax=Anguilla anguilla TaxID=7936 RepID=A0A0E9T6S9_ANGAN